MSDTIGVVYEKEDGHVFIFRFHDNKAGYTKMFQAIYDLSMDDKTSFNSDDSIEIELILAKAMES